MARLGVDFGTTNTVAVVEDRGLFSVVNHEAHTASGTIVQDVFPSTILIDQDSGQRRFGLEAERQLAQGGVSGERVYIASLKRELHQYSEGKLATFNALQSESSFDLAELLTDFLRALAGSIRSSTVSQEHEPLEAVITWPANANGAQRHITRQTFRDAGFEVLDSLSEPTASAIELAECIAASGWRNGKTESPAVAVFDLGGGTFDASVVRGEDRQFQVLASGGIGQLGGDDFDDVLIGTFLEKLNIPPNDLGALSRRALLRHVRAQKEMISTGAVKSLFLNPQEFGLAGGMVSVAVEEFYERIRPILAPAVEKLAKVIESASAGHKQIEATTRLTIYLVGGSSKLPLVAEMVNQAFDGCQIILSDKPFRSVAMGAAICAADRVIYRDVFARHFGLMRLRDHGRAEAFDTIFQAGTPMPRKGEPPLEKVAWYHPAHNIGHLRYLECSSVGVDGLPAGDTRSWSDILFPYDPDDPLMASPSTADITATDRFAREPVCEIYRCDSDGVITVELQRSSRNDSRCYEIYHQ